MKIQGWGQTRVLKGLNQSTETKVHPPLRAGTRSACKSAISRVRKSFQIFFSLRRGHGLLALLRLLLCSVAGHYPLANFCLLVWREHLENLAIL